MSTKNLGYTKKEWQAFQKEHRKSGYQDDFFGFIDWLYAMGRRKLRHNKLDDLKYKVVW